MPKNPFERKGDVLRDVDYDSNEDSCIDSKRDREFLEQNFEVWDFSDREDDTELIEEIKRCYANE